VLHRPLRLDAGEGGFAFPAVQPDDTRCFHFRGVTGRNVGRSDDVDPAFRCASAPREIRDGQTAYTATAAAVYQR
jgi:hypothetical protein